MPVELKREGESGTLLKVTARGKLEAKDYDRFSPAVEELIKQYGKLDILLVLDDFHGWTAGALWEDIKFDLKHFGDIRRLAIVGETKWEKGMATFCKPFTRAEIRFFERERLDEARNWLEPPAQL